MFAQFQEFGESEPMARRRTDSEDQKELFSTPPTDYVDEKRGCLFDLKLMGYIIAGFLLFFFVLNQIGFSGPVERTQIFDVGQLIDTKYHVPKLPSEAEGISLF